MVCWYNGLSCMNNSGVIHSVRIRLNVGHYIIRQWWWNWWDGFIHVHEVSNPFKLVYRIKVSNILKLVYQNQISNFCFISIWYFISSQFSSLLSESIIMDGFNMYSEGENENDNCVNGACHHDEYEHNQSNLSQNFGPCPLITRKEPFLECLSFTTSNLCVIKIKKSDSMHTIQIKPTYILIYIGYLLNNGSTNGTIFLLTVI